LFERAWRVWRQIEGRAGPNLLMCQQELALCLHKDGQHMRADAMYDSAMSGMAEVTERYARAAEKEARATQAAKRHARALELGAVGAGARKGAGAGKDVENVPPLRRRTNTAALSAPAPLTDAEAPRAFLRRSSAPLNEFRVKQQRRAPRARTSVTQATTKAFQAASAATAAAKRRQSEDDAAGKPAWRSGGVTQTRRGEKQLTNPFAYGDGRFAGKHR
jgi:hypothetical protein